MPIHLVMDVLLPTRLRGPRGVLGMLVLGALAWGAVASWDEAARVAAAWNAEPTPSRIAPSRPLHARVPSHDGPERLVARLRALGLDGDDWRPNDVVSGWTARLERTVGGVQLTCLLASSDADTIERAEVDLEIYARHPTERGKALRDDFRAAIALVAPGLDDQQLDQPVPWEVGEARLERLPDTGSREVLRFTCEGAVGQG